MSTAPENIVVLPEPQRTPWTPPASSDPDARAERAAGIKLGQLIRSDAPIVPEDLDRLARIREELRLAINRLESQMDDAEDRRRVAAAQVNAYYAQLTNARLALQDLDKVAP